MAEKKKNNETINAAFLALAISSKLNEVIGMKIAGKKPKGEIVKRLK